jgi:hypothetical protein
MARGWESKSVEAQQEERARQEPAQTSPEEDRDRRVRRQTLTLALARMQADLAGATAPAHRRMLETAIADLQKQLSEL